MEVIYLDAMQMTERKQAHAYLKEKLSFPDYYGKNLDALYDCLTEKKDVEIHLLHEEEADGYFLLVKKVLLDAAGKEGLTLFHH